MILRNSTLGEFTYHTYNTLEGIIVLIFEERKVTFSMFSLLWYLKLSQCLSKGRLYRTANR